MSEGEPFLTRWSRLKQETAKGAPAPPAADQSPPARTAPGDEAPGAAPSVPDSEPAATETFDPATLPPLDSIAAGTDIRAFLARGVPPELTRAALRRAWAADPAIRDFIGLSENSWDFTAPDGVPGFGPMRPTDDLRELLAQVGRHGSGPASNAESGSVPHSEAAASPPEATASAGRDDLPQGDTHELVTGVEEAETVADQSADMQSPNIASKTQDVAARNTGNAKDLSPSIRRRGHGGALPR